MLFVELCRYLYNLCLIMLLVNKLLLEVLSLQVQATSNMINQGNENIHRRRFFHLQYRECSIDIYTELDVQLRCATHGSV